MRTTLNVDDQLLAAAKQRAVEEKISLTAYFENALRESLSRSRAQCQAIRLVTSGGQGTKPGVDLSNGRSLREIMDDA